MNVVLNPEQQCAASTLDLFNNSTALKSAEVALEVQIAADVVADCVNDKDAVCTIDEDAAAYADVTAAYTQACEAAGGVILLDYDVNATCLSAEDLSPSTAQYNIRFRNIDVCAAPDDCDDSMTDFLFLSKGSDIFDALRDSASVPLVCFDAECNFVRSSPGVAVEIGQIPGCPTVAPTTMPTIANSGAVDSSMSFLATNMIAWMILTAGLFGTW